ncbi:MAG: pyridoxal phosphate-dependent aminotransferase [Planctomycetes bacterium]|nr:pyridoxal phosphate-dependent aminotransferase [Planctomycetota bacterium]MCC7170943.1 pyridoxal phosphate-dependent aminotransferase [Planctomycetota bacterium]
MTTTNSDDERGAFRDVPYMGVIWVVAEAMKLGFRNGHPDWCNLGQGQPECGPMAGAPPRIESIDIDPSDHAYGPLEGIPELRERVASHYNRLFRKGKRSQYGPQNVAIVQGGRLGLTRAMAALSSCVVGYQVPDYTAYEDMLTTHLARLSAVPVRARPEDGFTVPPARFERAAKDLGLSAFLLSNPTNPTGALLQDDALDGLVRVARKRRVTLLLDEFYSHFIYTADGKPGAGAVSGAQVVDDVERDPVVLIDGLTKSFRYPGWRVGWAVGPSAMVQSMARTASAIDGGPSRIAQRAALLALEPKRADQETKALRKVFAAKRNVMLDALKRLGIRFAHEPLGTFYCWGSLAQLPAPFDDPDVFFRRALERKVMTVPGRFFDVDPGGYRRGPSPDASWMRFSFGPPMDNVKLGLGRLEQMLKDG